MRLQVILGVLLFEAVTPAWPQSTAEIKTDLLPLEQVLQYLPGYHSHANQNVGQTGGAKQEVVHPASAKVYTFATVETPPLRTYP